MKDESSGGAWGWMAVVAALLLLALGAAFYLRHRQAVAAAAERARVAEAEDRLQSVQARRQPSGDMGTGEPEASAPGVGDQESSVRSQGIDENAIRDAVGSVLREQQEAWNGGDVEAFAEHYWKSDDLTFSSGGKTTRGWEETLQGYRERYPTREAMGRLSFSNLEITPLGDAAALVLGDWRLERDGEPVSGNFSLVFRKLDGRWVIVHDHTSRAE